MRLWSAIARRFRRSPPVLAAAIPDITRGLLTPAPLKISAETLAWLKSPFAKERKQPFTGLPTPPPGVRPQNDPPPKGMAFDDASKFGGSAPGIGGVGGVWGAWAGGNLWGEGLWFPGYPYLAELAQRPEYRHISETFAEEMTRKWVKLTTSGDGDDDKTDKLAALDAAMKKFNLREAFHRAAELDGFMGMGLIYIDTGATDDPDELAKPLPIRAGKIGKGQLRGFVPIDPTWVSPVEYNSTDPLREDYFRPSVWYVMGKRVHATRLLIIRSREIPDLLKAAYNFGGLSLSQMAKPYVDNWLRTRQSVSDIVHSFTVFVLKTVNNSMLDDPTLMMNRISAFILGRDNKGLMLIDKETEDFANVSAQLGTLDALQAQAQEQMASVTQIPLVKLLGVTPKGLNASSDGEVRSFYDRIKAKQEKTFGAPLTIALQVIQLSEFGEIDETIGYEFQSLWELDDAGKAAVEKTKADTDSVYMADGVVTNEEIRDKIRADPSSPYHGLKGPAPELPEPTDVDPDKSDVANKIDKEGAEGEESGSNSGV